MIYDDVGKFYRSRDLNLLIHSNFIIAMFQVYYFTPLRFRNASTRHICYVTGFAVIPDVVEFILELSFKPK